MSVYNGLASLAELVWGVHLGGMLATTVAARIVNAAEPRPARRRRDQTTTLPPTAKEGIPAGNDKCVGGGQRKACRSCG